jgi:hypothetical protein
VLVGVVVFVGVGVFVAVSVGVVVGVGVGVGVAANSAEQTILIESKKFPPASELVAEKIRLYSVSAATKFTVLKLHAVVLPV